LAFRFTTPFRLRTAGHFHYTLATHTLRSSVRTCWLRRALRRMPAYRLPSRFVRFAPHGLTTSHTFARDILVRLGPRWFSSTFGSVTFCGLPTVWTLRLLHHAHLYFTWTVTFYTFCTCFTRAFTPFWFARAATAQPFPYCCVWLDGCAFPLPDVYAHTISGFLRTPHHVYCTVCYAVCVAHRAARLPFYSRYAKRLVFCWTSHWTRHTPFCGSPLVCRTARCTPFHHTFPRTCLRLSHATFLSTVYTHTVHTHTPFAFLFTHIRSPHLLDNTPRSRSACATPHACLRTVHTFLHARLLVSPTLRLFGHTHFPWTLDTGYRLHRFTSFAISHHVYHTTHRPDTRCGGTTHHTVATFAFLYLPFTVWDLTRTTVPVTPLAATFVSPLHTTPLRVTSDHTGSSPFPTPHLHTRLHRTLRFCLPVTFFTPLHCLPCVPRAYNISCQVAGSSLHDRLFVPVVTHTRFLRLHAHGHTFRFACTGSGVPQFLHTWTVYRILPRHRVDTYAFRLHLRCTFYTTPSPHTFSGCLRAVQFHTRFPVYHDVTRTMVAGRFHTTSHTRSAFLPSVADDILPVVRAVHTVRFHVYLFLARSATRTLVPLRSIYRTLHSLQFLTHHVDTPPFAYLCTVRLLHTCGHTRARTFTPPLVTRVLPHTHLPFWFYCAHTRTARTPHRLRTFCTRSRTPAARRTSHFTPHTSAHLVHLPLRGSRTRLSLDITAHTHRFIQVCFTDGLRSLRFPLLVSRFISRSRRAATGWPHCAAWFYHTYARCHITFHCLTTTHAHHTLSHVPGFLPMPTPFTTCGLRVRLPLHTPTHTLRRRSPHFTDFSVAVTNLPRHYGLLHIHRARFHTQFTARVLRTTATPLPTRLRLFTRTTGSARSFHTGRAKFTVAAPFSFTRLPSFTLHHTAVYLCIHAHGSVYSHGHHLQPSGSHATLPSCFRHHRFTTLRLLHLALTLVHTHCSVYTTIILPLTPSRAGHSFSSALLRIFHGAPLVAFGPRLVRVHQDFLFGFFGSAFSTVGSAWFMFRLFSVCVWFYLTARLLSPTPHYRVWTLVLYGLLAMGSLLPRRWTTRTPHARHTRWFWVRFYTTGYTVPAHFH